MTKKVLFILKKRISYGFSYGLLNSCQFLVDYLKSIGHGSKLVQVEDAHRIDHEVHEYKPDYVFLEAIWCPPDKLPILLKFHPKVNWFVRIHSNTPFIANEGIAIDWIKDYAEISKKNDKFKISANALRFIDDIKGALDIDLTYTPNIYTPKFKEKEHKEHGNIRVGCFGAIRPMKNQLIQAIAAIRFANFLKKNLRFHINGRAEQTGESVMKNLISLFENSPHKLIVHDWLEHDDFLDLAQSMDIGLQCSLTESFNIVAADMVSQDVPMIGSPEIQWLNPLYQADATNSTSILEKMKTAWSLAPFKIHRINNTSLTKYNDGAKRVWSHLIK